MENIRILFAGDFCIRGRNRQFLTDEKIAELSQSVRTVTKNYDLSVVNIETVFTDTPTPTKKSGPNICSPTKALELLKGFGFTLGAFANNHSMDQGAEAAIASYNAVAGLGMACVGFGKNIGEAVKPVRFDIKGRKISVLNFAESEFVPATYNSPGFAPMDFISNLESVQKEKDDCDCVLVYLHAGSEHCPYPREGLAQYCRAMVKGGADAVIISHPHCPCGIEYINGKPIVYSMGNFYMSKANDIRDTWNIGYMTSLEFTPDGKITLTPIPYEFGNDGSYFRFLEAEEKEKFLHYIDKLSDVVTSTSPEKYHRLLEAWSIAFVEEAMEGYLHDFLVDDKYRDDLFNFIRNCFTCESHSETFKNYYILFTENRLGEYAEELKQLKQLQERPF